MKELIAKKLIKLRGDKSREAVSESVGISVSALQMYENGQRIPRDDIKVRLAKFYNVTVQEVFYDYEQHETCSSVIHNSKINSA
ncbi:helix-turn-helix transcriptional regulator [Paenibacillus tyrfis]|uniref:helix-turn-helix transcriptional regulator n=1 Tax=Paenibacillus tyrfis TaxID=1501230 RepID=UPI0006908783|nr:helix-turn-helix transcriptional regulator [Paenibacillus tyrfis]